LAYTTMAHMWPRTLYSLAVIFIFMRALQFMRYFSSVGVLTIVLGSMMNDVALFIIILLPLTCGFAVANAALMPQRTGDWYAILGSAPIWEPFWGVIGYFDIQERMQSIQDHSFEYPAGVTVPILTWAYQFIATIILVNLLIAQMADTYSRITSEGFLRWQFERAQLISEFKDTKKPLPPPLNVVWMVLANLYKLLFPVKDVHIHEGFKYMPSEHDMRHWQQQEQIALRLCLTQREVRAKETPESKIEHLESLLQKQEENTRRISRTIEEMARRRQ